MADELRNVMADLELSLVDTAARPEQAEMNLLYVAVLDLEQRIEAVHAAVAFVADNIAHGSLPFRTAARVPHPASPGGGAGDLGRPAVG